MRKMIVALTVAVIFCIPSVSLAQPDMGPYFSVFIGAAMPVDQDVAGFDLDDEVEFDPGINIGGTLGYDYGYLRLEGEISYKEAEIKRVTDRISGDSYRDIDGSVGVAAFLGNAFVDFHTQGPVTPYIGGGVGFAAVYQDDIDGTSTADGLRTRLYWSDDDLVFAYQAGAGVEIAISPMFSLDLSYRYFGTSNATFNEDTDIDNEMEFASHNVAAGLRIKF
jgi:opacity protein-like surface antigen